MSDPITAAWDALLEHRKTPLPAQARKHEERTPPCCREAIKAVALAVLEEATTPVPPEHSAEHAETPTGFAWCCNHHRLRARIEGLL